MLNLKMKQGVLLGILATCLLGASGYGAIVVLGPSGTPITSVTCTAGCSQTGAVLDVNAAGGSGYSSVQDEGSGLTARTALNFAGAGVSCADDTTRTTCTISGGGATGYQTVQDEGGALTQRTTINFIGASVSCVDNAGSSRTDCTVTASGGSGLTQAEVMQRTQTAFGGF